jgi:ATP-dependent RNA helicase DDX3X
MADQLSGNMGNLSIDGGQAPQPTARSYIPPHLRNKMGAGNTAPANGPPPMAAPPVNGPGPMNGLNNSAWAG